MARDHRLVDGPSAAAALGTPCSVSRCIKPAAYTAISTHDRRICAGSDPKLPTDEIVTRRGLCEHHASRYANRHGLRSPGATIFIGLAEGTPPGTAESGS